MTKQLLEVMLICKWEIQIKPEAKGKEIYRIHGMSWLGLQIVLSRVMSCLFTRAKVLDIVIYVQIERQKCFCSSVILTFWSYIFLSDVQLLQAIWWVVVGIYVFIHSLNQWNLWRHRDIELIWVRGKLTLSSMNDSQRQKLVFLII